MLACSPADDLKSNERIYMTFLPEVCLWSRNNRFNFENHKSYDPDYDLGAIPTARTGMI